jgi:hypothetical protein
LKSDVLKKGYFIRYIKKATTNKPAHVVLGGKINDIIENNGIIERLKIKINTGKTFILKVKDNNNIFLYYKEKKVAEQRKIEAIQWVKQLTPYERKKMINMKKKRDVKDITSEEKKTLTKTFYDWLYARRPELKTK